MGSPTYIIKRGEIEVGYKKDLKYEFLSQKKLIDEEYDVIFKQIEESESIYEIIGEITKKYHYTESQKSLVRRLLSENLKANFFSTAGESTSGHTINSQIIFEDEEFIVSFSNSGYKVITIHSKKKITKPEKYDTSVITDRMREFHSEYKKYKNNGKTKDGKAILLDKYAQLKGEDNNFLFRFKEFWTSGISDKFEHIDELLEIVKNIEEANKREVERTSKRKEMFFSLMDDLEIDLKLFRDSGWKVEFSRISKHIYNEYEKTVEGLQ